MISRKLVNYVMSTYRLVTSSRVLYAQKECESKQEFRLSGRRRPAEVSSYLKHEAFERLSVFGGLVFAAWLYRVIVALAIPVWST
jgi:hypothetical protein